MRSILLSVVVVCLCIMGAAARPITFCNEVIPVDNDFVANKLMATIRKQIPTASLSSLKLAARRYFPYISQCLRFYGLPDDLKYIPIVECGFRPGLTSHAGARGFWQIMPEVAKNKGMLMTPTYDARDHLVPSTKTACMLLRENWINIKNMLGVKSWVLTAACYNFGIGNIRNAVRKQGQTNYFKLQLNDETAAYVYKLIAVKELFERPERYMSGFDENIFREGVGDENADVNALARTSAKPNTTKGKSQAADDDATAGLGAFEIADNARPAVPTKTQYLAARLVVEKGERFQDGGRVRVQLTTDLQLPNSFNGKGRTLFGHGWLIDDRVFIDLGFDEVEVLDATRTKGITVEQAERDGQSVILKTEVPIE